jgi:gamma-glutamyl:cysteine ligase YbdK (ATP-grasp superfamily)
LLLDGRLVPARELAYHAVGLAGAYAADLGCWDELMLLHRLIQDGNGAERQRRAERDGGLRLVLRRLADQTYPATKATVQPMSSPRFTRHREALSASTSGASA